MEIKFSVDPEAEKAGRVGAMRGVANSAEEWQAFLRRTHGGTVLGPAEGTPPAAAAAAAEEETAPTVGAAVGAAVVTPEVMQRQFLEHGLCTMPTGLSPDQIARSHAEVLGYYDDVMFTLSQLDKQEDLEKGGFTTFKARDTGAPL